ncbi:hypothetical protein Sya03_15510 [Spirilliplanes yamanashiensis]|uniref:Uncharacterized protein n=1 Tax=Spirilliplanes yamanashiensis TaxID=42233 RepID=A0A8J3Y6B6_9ACTN|nr:hypothetical protein Sya03_15510 [Spirilliplanes yamanashiensis]
MALYGGAALLTAAGAAWWVAAAPAAGDPDPRVAAWGAAAARAMSVDDVRVAASGTAVLRSGAERSWDADVSIGQFQLRMVCAGEGVVSVRTGPQDNGAAYTVTCGETPVPQAAVLGAAGPFRMEASASRGTSVFRWQLARIIY